MSRYQLAIDNILGVERARIELETGKVTSVVGPNASGKTSVAVAAVAVLAHDNNPLGITAAQNKLYLHDAAPPDAPAEAELFEDGETVATWRPAQQTVTAAGPPLAIPQAAGAVDFLAKRTAKERAAMLQEVLLPDPDTVLDAVRDKLAGWLGPDDLEGAMRMLQERGWDDACSVFTERGRKAKKEWADIAGRTWGAKVAADWRPDNWLADWDNLTVGLAEEAVVAARDDWDALKTVQAISQHDAERAAEAADEVPRLEQELSVLEAEHRDAEGDFEALRGQGNDLFAAERAAMQARGEAQRAVKMWEQAELDRLECPHCAKPVSVHQDKDGTFSVEEHDPDFVAEQIAEYKEKLGEADVEHGYASQALAEHKDRVDELEKAAAQARQAANDKRHDLKRAKEMAAKATAVIDSPDRQQALADAEQAVEDAKAVLKAVDDAAVAAGLHGTIVRYIEIAGALGPQGVRAKMMADGLETLNHGLLVLAEIANWPATQVDDHGAVTFGGRPAAMCSESERWRAQASIQLIVGGIAGAKAVVLDRADLLDEPNMGGLQAALQRVAERGALAVLVCYTGDPATAPTEDTVSIAGGVTADD